MAAISMDSVEQQTFASTTSKLCSTTVVFVVGLTLLEEAYELYEQADKSSTSLFLPVLQVKSGHSIITWAKCKV